jgi:AsmA family protein
MSKRSRVLVWAGAAFGILVIALAIFIATLDLNRAKKYLSATVSKTTGRELVIGGDIRLDWGWISRISATDIQFANASWSKHPQMAEVGLFDMEIDLWQLLTRFRLVLPKVTISEPRVILEKNAEGAANWDFRASAVVRDPVLPEKRTEFPVIQKLIIKGGALSFDDPVSKTQADLKSIEAEAEGFLDAPVTLKAEGSYQKMPLTLSFDGGSYENLRSSTKAYPVRIDLVVGKLKAKIDGNMSEPLEMKGEDVMLDLQGDDMANLYPILRLVFPKTPPYRLKGQLKHEGKVWSFSDFSGRVGDSDLSGNIRVDTAPKRPVMKADLISNLLDFDDLAGFIGGNPGTGPGETASTEQKKEASTQKDSDRIFPDQRYDLERLHAMDADVTLRAKKILAPKLPIDNLDATLRLKDGVLQFTPATFGVANGQMEIYSTFDGSRQPSKVKIDARMRHLNLKRFLGQSSLAQKTLGPIGGRIVIKGAGESFRELMATASGNTFLVMASGEISAKLVELAGLDVAESIGFAVRGDQSIPVRCALMDLKATDGQATVQTLVFDTADTVLLGEGSIDLRDEKVNLVMLPVPKDFSPLSLRSYIRARGPFKNISVFPDPIKTGTDSVVKKIFNVLTLLILSPFQPRDLGQGKDIDCDALLAKVQKQDPQGVVLKDVYRTRNPNTVPSNREQAQRQASRSQEKQ